MVLYSVNSSRKRFVILYDLVCAHNPRCDFVCFQVPAVSDECVLKVEGLEPNQKYVFAVAAYNCQGDLMGNTIGGSTSPLLASLPVSLLYTWAHLAQVHYTPVKKHDHLLNIFLVTFFCPFNIAAHKVGEKAGLVWLLLIPSSGGISNRAVCCSKESLPRAVDPLYLH